VAPAFIAPKKHYEAAVIEKQKQDSYDDYLDAAEGTYTGAIYYTIGLE
jgi:hypothetical protein